MWYYLIKEGQTTLESGEKAIREERTPDLNPEKRERIYKYKERKGIPSEETKVQWRGEAWRGELKGK